MGKIMAMSQDYRDLSLDEHELLEKQTLRTITQALQQYSREARTIFEGTPAPTDAEIIVIAEDLVQYALEVAECYPIDQRFAGFIDYKRVRWLPTAFGLFPQALLVDAKASTEDYRETLQRSQLSMDADFISKGEAVRLLAGFPPHIEVRAYEGVLLAPTTSIFVHFHYSAVSGDPDRYRRLHSIFLLCLPHACLKPRYNPTADVGFWKQGKHSPSRNEEPRIRVSFAALRASCPWRLQQLKFVESSDYTDPVWRDQDDESVETLTRFDFVPR